MFKYKPLNTNAKGCIKGRRQPLCLLAGPPLTHRCVRQDTGSRALLTFFMVSSRGIWLDKGYFMIALLTRARQISEDGAGMAFRVCLQDST